MIEFDEDENSIVNDDDERTYIPLEYFFNATFGYQFNKRKAVGLNAEINRDFLRNLNFFPVFINARYHVFDFGESIFIRAGYGILTDIGKAFETGTLYMLGAGLHVADEYSSTKAFIIGFDFTRKRFGVDQSSKISSFSVSLELQF